MTTQRYNTPRISPKQFLLEVMWDCTVDLPLRIDAADKLTKWIERGDFRFQHRDEIAAGMGRRDRRSRGERERKYRWNKSI